MQGDTSNGKCISGIGVFAKNENSDAVSMERCPLLFEKESKCNRVIFIYPYKIFITIKAAESCSRASMAERFMPVSSLILFSL
jgi:hypothetical protein